MPAKTAAIRVIKKLVDAGHIAYFAGGWVRDFLMKHPSDDIDIATSAKVEEIQALFPKTIPVGVSFGIVIVVQDQFHFEVATFRKDRGYVDGRRPTGIDPAAPEEDAKRRDFTINGMFYDPLQEKLIDYIGGQEDLKKGIIRAIGNPQERFLEDRLRMMRAVRYSTRFNFPIEAKTFSAIFENAESLLPAVAMERVWQEFKKMAQFAHFDLGLVALHKLKLLPTIFPQLKDMPTQEIEKRVFPIQHFPKDIPPIAQLLELFPNQTLEQDLELCDFLKLSNQEREIVHSLHRAKSLFNMPASWLKNLKKSEWVEFYAHPFAEMCLAIIAAHISEKERQAFFKEHEARQKELESAIVRNKTKKPILDASRLMKEGIPEGKKLGFLLKEAECLSIDEGIEDPERLLARLLGLWK